MNHRHSLPRFLSILMALLLMACATTPAPEPSPAMAAPAPAPSAAPAAMSAPDAVPATDPAMATVYIYRPKSFVGMALQPTVMLDGKDLLDARNGTVWTGKFEPGHYAFQMDDKKSGAELDLKAGEAYYLRVDIVMGVWKGGGRMTQVAPQQGVTDTQKLNPLPASEVKHTMFKGM